MQRYKKTENVFVFSFLVFRLYLLGLFHQDFLHLNSIPITDANEINARCIQMEMLQAIHLIET